MLTTFGRLLRDLRLERSELLKDMAEGLKVSPSFLSAVETGKKSIPASWPNALRTLYALTPTQEKAMRDAIDESPKSVTIDLTNQSGQRRGVAVALARQFDDLSDETLASIQKLMLTVRRRQSGD